MNLQNALKLRELLLSDRWAFDWRTGFQIRPGDPACVACACVKLAATDGEHVAVGYRKDIMAFIECSEDEASFLYHPNYPLEHCNGGPRSAIEAVSRLDSVAAKYGIDLPAEAAKHSATQVRESGVGSGHSETATLGTQEDGHACGLPVQHSLDSLSPAESRFVAACRAEAQAAGQPVEEKR